SQARPWRSSISIRGLGAGARHRLQRAAGALRGRSGPAWPTSEAAGLKDLLVLAPPDALCFGQYVFGLLAQPARRGAQGPPRPATPVGEELLALRARLRALLRVALMPVRSVVHLARKLPAHGHRRTELSLCAHARAIE